MSAPVDRPETPHIRRSLSSRKALGRKLLLPPRAITGMISVMETPRPDAPPPRERHLRTAWDYLREGFVRAHKRRPMSFYLLLAMPFALMFAVGLLDRTDIRQFAIGLCLLFLFFGIVMIRAVSDIFDITRELLRARRASFRDTLGEPDFAAALGERVKQAKGE